MRLHKYVLCHASPYVSLSAVYMRVCVILRCCCCTLRRWAWIGLHLFEMRVDLMIQGQEHGVKRPKQPICATPNVFLSECVGDASQITTR
jgi:hypothetical protein